MNKVIIVVAVLLILGGGAFLLMRNSNTQPANTVTETPTPTAQELQPTGTESVTPDEDEAMKEAEEVVNVTLTSAGFAPASVTVEKGTKVVWTNNTEAAATVDSAPHPVHTSYTPLNLGSFADGESVELIFTEPGTYNYHNHFRSSQTGRVIVEE